MRSQRNLALPARLKGSIEAGQTPHQGQEQAKVCKLYEQR
jgi:hypothetical protein